MGTETVLQPLQSANHLLVAVSDRGNKADPRDHTAVLHGSGFLHVSEKELPQITDGDQTLKLRIGD